MITQLKIDVQFKTPFATEDEFDIFLDSFLEYIESNEVLFGGGSDVSYIDGVVHSETKTAIQIKEIVERFFSNIEIQTIELMEIIEN